MGDSNNVSRDMVHFNYYILNSIFIWKKKKEEERIFTSLNYHQECQLYSREDY